MGIEPSSLWRWKKRITYGQAVGTGIKGSQFHQVERNEVFEIVIGGDAVRTLHQTLSIFL
jgi:hypothetical protein